MDYNNPFKKNKQQGRLSGKAGIYFACGIVLVLIVSCFVVLKSNDFDFKAAIGGEVESTTESTTEETTDTTESSDNYYLLWCTDSEKTSISFMWIVRAILPDCRVNVFSPSTEDMIEYDGTRLTIQELYKTYGEDTMVNALASNYKIKFSAYMGADSPNFKKLINDFGSIPVKVTNQIDYRGIFNLTLPKGENKLRGEQLYNYLQFIGFDINSKSTDKGRVLLNIFDVVFTSSNGEKLDTIFQNIANGLTTNITIVDFSAARDTLTYVFNNGIKGNAVQTIEELKG